MFFAQKNLGKNFFRKKCQINAKIFCSSDSNHHSGQKSFFCAISEFRPPTPKIWKIADSIFPNRKKKFSDGPKKISKNFFVRKRFKVPGYKFLAKSETKIFFSLSNLHGIRFCKIESRIELTFYPIFLHFHSTV